MTTNVAGDSARQFPWQMTHYIVRGGPNDPVLPSGGGSNGIFGFNSTLILPPVPGTQTPPAVPAPRNMSIATGILIGTIPIGAWIVKVQVAILTVFNAGTTNVLTVGTVAANTAYASLPGTLNNLVKSGDVNAGATGTTDVTTGIGPIIAQTADQDVYVQYTQTGTAATTGIASILIEFTGLQG